MMVPFEWKFSTKALKSRTGMFLVIAASALSLANCNKKVPAPASETLGDPLLNDDCYAPTRKVNANDKDAWMKSAIPAAQDAERISGVPAAAIAAMSARESGYGTTRLYIGSFNAYGYKWRESIAEGKPKWALACQPKEDVGNEYVKFKNLWDATLFVGRKLASSSRYKPATDRYVQDRRNGVDVKTAVDRWVNGIADAGYNYDPPAYKRDIVNMINNYQSPSATKSKDYNLYWISGAASPRSK